ncbi:MAG: transcription antitermination factor NusB [Methylococcales bacterium]|nr:transcription antitermination factor NusB [Methylococcales bacterium]MDD5753899.1 transcription antitermination factor NusB [Methylococcales bacterium]
MSNSKSNPKSNARQAVAQALYQWQITGQNLNLIEQYFIDEQFFIEGEKVDTSYFSELFHGVPQDLIAIDALLSEFVDRAVDAVDPVERAVLRLGTYELIHCIETPYKVIINESINIAKHFGADGSHRYVNGILDKVAQKQRAEEVRNKRKTAS